MLRADKQDCGGKTVRCTASTHRPTFTVSTEQQLLVRGTETDRQTQTDRETDKCRDDT